MKRKMTAMLAILLAILLAVPAMVMADPMDDVERMYIDGMAFVPLRSTAYAFGLEVGWDEELGAVTISFPESSDEPFEISFPPADIGGFIEDGVTWVPYFVARVIIGMFFPPEMAEISRSDFWQFENFADIREASFSTDLPHGEISLGHILFMNDNLYSRSPFTYREKEAAAWLVEELLAIGFDWEYIDVQEFTFREVVELGVTSAGGWNTVTMPMMLGDGVLRETQLSQNVVLTIPGQSERKIIVGAHYDTLPYPGASDNASGTALLLESAQRMLELDNYHTIVYVFFGAEEVGLLGAWYYYHSLTDEQRENLVKMVNADVLFEGPYFLYGAGTVAPLDDDDFLELLVDVFGFDLEMLPDDVPLEDVLPVTSIIMSAAMQGHIDPIETAVSLLVDEIALQVMEEHDVVLHQLPHLIFGSSDNLAFVFSGHTVVVMFGMHRIDSLGHPEFGVFFDYFTMQFLHSPRDDFHYIEAHSPGLMLDAMRTFSLFLEAILLAQYE